MGAVPVTASQGYRYWTWWLALGWLGLGVVQTPLRQMLCWVETGLFSTRKNHVG